MTRSNSGTPACGRCGSTVLRHYAYGLPSGPPQTPDVRLAGCVIHEEAWDRECLTCGQRRHLMGGGDSLWTTSASDVTGVAEAVRQYAAQVRETVGTAQAPVISYAGLWLLLASLAPVATDVTAISEILGSAPDQAYERAHQLLDAVHPTVGAAIGGWLADSVVLAKPLPVRLESLPGQADLDRWAAERTRGLIDAFPLQVTADTMLLLATALVAMPRWRQPLPVDDDGMLELDDDGLQAIVATSAAGAVAVAKPFTQDGIDVLSVIAAPDVPAPRLWDAVDEVVQRLDSGQLWNHDFPGHDLANGHAWRVVERVRTFPEWEAPPDGARRWLSRLPRWSASATHDLLGAPGVAEIAEGVAARLPERSRVACVQAATAEYDEGGFSAAAVTALGMRATGMPRFVDRTVQQVQVTFDRPHALVAIARGGPWEGVPLFHAWVTARERPPTVSA